MHTQPAADESNDTPRIPPDPRIPPEGSRLIDAVQVWVNRLGYGHLDCWADAELLDHLLSHAMSALDTEGVPDDQQVQLGIARVADALVVLYGGTRTPAPDDFPGLLAAVRESLVQLGYCWTAMYGPNEALAAAREELDHMEAEYNAPAGASVMYCPWCRGVLRRNTDATPSHPATFNCDSCEHTFSLAVIT